MAEEKKFESQDTDFDARVRASFLSQKFMQHLGAELTALHPGFCEIRVPYRDELTQQHGYLHAGVSGAIADSASGYAAYTLMPRDSNVLTVEYKLNLVAPAQGESLVARARVLRAGKTLTTCAADVFAVTGSEEKLVATSLSTIIMISSRKP